MISYLKKFGEAIGFDAMVYANSIEKKRGRMVLVDVFRFFVHHDDMYIEN